MLCPQFWALDLCEPELVALQAPVENLILQFHCYLAAQLTRLCLLGFSNSFSRVLSHDIPDHGRFDLEESCNCMSVQCLILTWTLKQFG